MNPLERLVAGPLGKTDHFLFGMAAGMLLEALILFLLCVLV